MRLLKLAIIAVVAFYATSASAKDIRLKWDENTEPDLAGYKVYYKIDGPGDPYDGVSSDQGPSPITVTLAEDENPTPGIFFFTVRGLRELNPGERYRFVVTAFDNEDTYPPGGFESGYSEEADTDGAPTDPGNLEIVAE